ncbi:MAG: hypothetical protein R3C13_08645 [Hyphomonas sp.]|uniref:hypothetical protein n=1 Tax=Hyphomonas sp. TaxID=87 RepID=UPI0035280058
MTDTPGFEGEIVLGVPASPGAPASTGTLKASFVRYPGCQQLNLWLPADGPHNYTRLAIHGPGGTVEDGPISDRLNGRIQILTDTLPWPPGRYTVAITHRDGWHHTLTLEKLEEGVAPPAPEPPPLPPSSDQPIIYRDGFGRELPNEDLEMRAKAFDKLMSDFRRHLEFEGNFRAGTIIYVDGAIRIPFSHEMCGGGVHFSIDVPPPARWEAVTGRPLADRDGIIDFLAAETQRRQCPSWRYKIHDDRIDYMD